MENQPQRPTSDNDREGWKTYWEALHIPWRTEPEIGEERQQFLTERRTTTPDLKQGVYPFKDIKLSRADVEWLLAMHESAGIRGPVDWTDEQQRERNGLNLRGVDLRGVDLSGLPLANAIAGSLSDAETGVLEYESFAYESKGLRNVFPLDQMLLYANGVDYLFRAGIHREHGRTLTVGESRTEDEAPAGHFEGANFSDAHLEGANLGGAHLDGANLAWSHFEHASLHKASLIGAYCGFTRMETTQRSLGMRLVRQYDDTEDYPGANFNGTDLSEAMLQGADLTGADLRSANLTEANLAGASLRLTHLEGTKLRSAWLGGEWVSTDIMAKLRINTPNFPARLGGTDLARANCDTETRLEGVGLGSRKLGFVRLADIEWGGANLTVVDWAQLETADNQRPDALSRQAQREVTSMLYGQMQATHLGYKITLKFLLLIFPLVYRFIASEVACRANRQLASALTGQGLGRIADRFVYRAHVCERATLLVSSGPFQYVGSWLLAAISGYGFKPGRSVCTYILVIGVFAGAYFGVTNFDIVPFLHTHATHLAWYEAIVLSISSFHGRGLFPTGLALGDPIAIIAAAEAVIGLLIEIIFIATFTQRFFSR